MKNKTKTKVKSKIKKKLIAIAISNGLVIFVILVSLILISTSVSDSIKKTIILDISSEYLKEAFIYTKKLRDENGLQQLEFTDFLTYALLNSDNWDKVDTKYFKEMYDSALRGVNILENKNKATEDLKIMLDDAYGSIVGNYEQMDITTETKIREVEREIWNEEKKEYETVVVEEEYEDYVIYWRDEWGIRAFYPIPSGFDYDDYDDYGAERTYGDIDTHEGNDILAERGTPIVAIESGTIEKFGWNHYGGWRIGIRSDDEKKYYYYAHMDKYASGMRQGMKINAGEVIGYIGDSGYGDPGTTGKFPTHLHLQIGVTYSSDKNEVWIDPYSILDFLRDVKAEVEIVQGGHEGINQKRNR